MTINVALLRETLEYIKEHPAAWNQDFWRFEVENGRCHTVMCFAGHAAVLDGVKWSTSVHGNYAEYVLANDADRKFVKGHPEYEWALIQDHKGRDALPVQFRAQRVLGLDKAQAEQLFRGSNTLAQLESIVEELEAEALANAS